MKTVIRGGYLIPMRDGSAEIISDGGLVIEGDRITECGSAATIDAHIPTADRVIHARGHAILPGFVNTHTHLAGALTKGITEDVPTYGGPFRIALGMHENVIRKEDVLLPGMVHGVEMLKTGTTTINECWWHQPQSARIIERVGLRGVVAAEIREVDSSTIGFGRLERNWDERLVQEGLQEAYDLFENWQGRAGGRITCRVAPDGPDRLRPETMGMLGDLARKHGVGLHAHLCSVPGEAEFMRAVWGKASVPLLRELGLLSKDFIGAHCVFMDDDDIAIMAETGACMSHTAFLVGKRGYYPPMDRIYPSGMSVSLGTDWLSNDMFQVMRSAIVIPRALFHDVGIRTAADVLRMATIGGARCLGLDGDIGSLEAGKKADVILVDLRKAWCQPLRFENLVSTLVYNASGGDVTHVWVDGELLVAEGRLTRFDEQELFAEAQAVAETVWARAKYLFEREGNVMTGRADLPVVDLTGLANAADEGDTAALQPIAAAFDAACRSFGFCYIANHGVPQPVTDAAFAMNAAFHALPLEEKQAIAINRAHRGYMAMASSVIVTSSIEKATKPNFSESFMLMHEVAPGSESGPLDGPNQFPSTPAGFRGAVVQYDAALNRLARRMTRMIAVALGLGPNGLDRYFVRPTTFSRLLHYPPTPVDTDAKQYGSAPHTDYGFITILAQDRTGGLQVRGRDHDWIDATPLDGTFVVNVGDMGSRWTNGQWRSTPHRVINRSGGDRYSMPYFYDPGAAEIIECLPTCCSHDNPPRFPPVRYGDYLMERIDANYAYRGKSGAT